MVSVTALWLPILISAVALFFVSFIFWMVLPHHRSDWQKVPDEEGLRKVMNDMNLQAGQYSVPYPFEYKDFNDPDLKKKYHEGPVGFFMLKPAGEQKMAGSLVLMFLMYLVISFFVAYICGHTLAPGAAYLSVFRVAGAVAVLGYTGSLLPETTWFGRSWSMTLKLFIDGGVYGLITAGIFAWLWPAA